MGRGPDDSWQDRDMPQTEDVGLPQHEDDHQQGRDTATEQQNP